MAVSQVSYAFEVAAHARGFKLVAGVDEVGRGALAGPVVAAACILDTTKPIPKGLDDSKKVTAKQRDRLAGEIKECAVAFAVAEVDAATVDRINILQATKLAMRQALNMLILQPEFVLIDAVTLSDLPYPQQAIIRGDSISATIAAASILAKVYRDGLMRMAAETYPAYGFDSHVGYGTAKHLAALREYGPTPLHRRSFRGVLTPADSIR